MCPVGEGSVSGAAPSSADDQIRSDQLARQNTENLEGAVTTDGWVRTTSRSGKHERDQRDQTEGPEGTLTEMEGRLDKREPAPSLQRVRPGQLQGE